MGVLFPALLLSHPYPFPTPHFLSCSIPQGEEGYRRAKGSASWLLASKISSLVKSCSFCPYPTPSRYPPDQGKGESEQNEMKLLFRVFEKYSALCPQTSPGGRFPESLEICKRNKTKQHLALQVGKLPQGVGRDVHSTSRIASLGQLC